MQDLPTTLEVVRSRIAQHRTSRRLNEQNTKATLIDPVLRVLGWDLEDIEEVQREYKKRPRDKPVDYAFLILRTPRLFVEAKSLSEDLSDRRWASQIMGYAAVAGVEWVVLTNGDEYRLYNAHAAVEVDEKLFRTVKVTDGSPLVQETLELLSKDRMQENRIEVLWKSHFVDRQVRSAMESIFSDDPDAGIVRLISKHTSNLSPKEIRASLARAKFDIEFPLESRLGEGILVAKPKGRVRVKASRPEPKGSASVSLQELIASRILVPPLDLVRVYKGHKLSARVEPDGRVTHAGQSCDSLSAAGAMARASVLGTPSGRKHPPTNGWTFWKFTGPNGELREIDTLRQEYSGQGR